MTKTIPAISTLAIACALPALADQPLDLGNVTITDTIAGQQTDLDRTGATVEVITGEELRAAPEVTVAEYLSRLPGLSVSANGGLGTTATLRVRGLDGKYIKVLVDGIDVTDPASTQTQFNWGGLTTTGISRIEVLKGSSSSLYGSRAIAGVVNITTDQRDGTPGTDVTVTGEGGSFSTFQGNVNLTHEGDRGGLSVTINHVTTDGFSARDGAANTEPDGYEATQLNFSGDIMATENLKLGFSALALDSEGDFDEFAGDGLPPFDEFTTVETRALRGFAEFATGAVDHTLSATWYRNDRVSNSNGFATPFLGERRKFDYTGSYAPSDMVRYTFGADWENESFDSGADQGETDNAGIFAEAIYAPSTDIDLSGSLRYDDHSTFGGNLSGRVAAAWRASEGTIVRAVAATGFRAPSLYELNSTLYGNAALQPEESTSFELGVERQFGAGFARATAFYTEIDNLIQFVTLTSFPQPFTGQYQQVAGTSTSKGIELSGEYAISDALGLFGNYTYTDAKDANGARLLRVPGHDVVLGLDARIGDRWGGILSVRHVADRPDEFGTVMEDYTVVNASVNYAISDNAEAYLRIENLFDEDYQTAAGFSASGQAFFAGLRGTF